MAIRLLRKFPDPQFLGVSDPITSTDLQEKPRLERALPR